MSAANRERLARLRPDVRQRLLEELTEPRLVAAAQREAGLSDPPPEEMLAALRDLLGSLLAEANLSDGGLLSVRHRLSRAIAHRLRIERDLREHPEIRSVPIAAPIIIFGVPRTGSTLLQRLLAQDPAARAPALWELECPSPPPEAGSREEDPRIARADRMLAETFRACPELRQLHPMVSRDPDECSWLLLSSLRLRQIIHYGVPGFGRTLTAENMLVTYRLHRTLLQLLTWRCPGSHLVLKDPSHLWFLDSILRVYPDARLIHTHRDPVRVVPSVVRLCTTLRSATSDLVSPRRIAEECLHDLPMGLAKASADRAAKPEAFHDVFYPDLVRDPVGEVRRIYDRFDLPWTAEAEAGMRGWLARSGHFERRPGRYEELAELGLSLEAITQAFAGYLKQFPLAPEA